MNSKELMEKGWKARENHEFEKAESLLHEALEAFKNEEDWFNTTECLNHLAYSKKIQAGVLADEGFDLAKQSLDIAKREGAKEVHVYRALLSLARMQGNYEKMLDYSQRCLELYDKPLNKADIMSHIARAQLRTGYLEKALETVEEALNLFEKHWEEERDPHRTIWKTSALFVKGLILYNQGAKQEAEKIGREALELAESIDNKTRTSQAENFLDLFN